MSGGYRVRNVVSVREEGMPPRFGKYIRTLQCGHEEAVRYSFPPTTSGYAAIKRIYSTKRARCYQCESSDATE